MRAEGKLIDIDAIYAARRKMFLAVAEALHSDFVKTHNSFAKLSPVASDGVSMGKRTLKNLSLAYLAADRNKKILADVFKTGDVRKEYDRPRRGARYPRGYELAPCVPRRSRLSRSSGKNSRRLWINGCRRRPRASARMF